MQPRVQPGCRRLRAKGGLRGGGRPSRTWAALTGALVIFGVTLASMRLSVLIRTAPTAAFCTLLSPRVFSSGLSVSRSLPQHFTHIRPSMSSSGSCDPPSQACPPLSRRLWSRYEPVAVCILHHPFVSGLGTGRLEQSTFKSYVGQDAFFLRSFAKAYAYALTKSDSQEHIENFSSLIHAVVEELKLHASLSSSLGIDLPSTQPNTACTAYTSFLLKIAERPSASVALILASMAPCMRLYAYLGQTLKARLGDEAGGGRYKEWIESYSSVEFEQAASLVETLLDQCHTPAPSSTKDVQKQDAQRQKEEEELFEAYGRAMDLELAFFDAWGGGEGGLRPRAVVVDFDGTCTVEDTTPLVAQAAELASASPDKTREEWASLTDRYLSAFSALMSSVTPSTDTHALLEKFATVDMDSRNAVAESRVLRGIKKGSMPTLLMGPLASSWRLQPYCHMALRLAASSPPPLPFLHFLSISWCDEIITTAMQVDRAEVTSNCLEYDGSTGLSTGNVIVTVNGAKGKQEHLRRLLSSPAASQGVGPSVYIGDSLTDLLALLEADVGIVIGQSSSLLKIADMMGVQMRPLLAYQPSTQAGTKKVLYKAESWVEVGAVLFGANSMARALSAAGNGR